MAKKEPRFKLNFWRLIRNINRIRQLIEDIVSLYERVKDLSDDTVTKALVKKIESTLEEVLDYEK